MNFLFKYQKPLTIAGFLLAVLFFGFLLYYFFFKPMGEEIAPGDGGAAETSTVPIGFPEAGTGTGQIQDGGVEQKLGTAKDRFTAKEPDDIAHGGVTKAEPLVDAPAIGTALSGDGSSLKFYSKDDGKFYRLNKDGTMTPLSEKIFYGVSQVTWSSANNKAVIEYPDGANIVYDFDTGEQATLPTHWKNYDFSPDGEKIVSKSVGLDPNNRWLLIANSDGSKARAIEDMGNNEEYVDVKWSPNNQMIATYREGSAYDRQEVYFVGLNKENFKSISIEGRGFEYIWSPAGDKMLYSVYSTNTGLKPSLWIVNASGDEIGSGRKSLKLETWATKCVFADNLTIYCAVPDNLPEGSGAFRELAETTNDSIYRIDIVTGAKSLVAIPDGSYTIGSVIISQDKRNLYFTDKTGKIYNINLQ